MSQVHERRNLAVRARRDAVAAWFDLHPRQLAALPAEVVDVMAERLGNAGGLEGVVAELRSTAQRWEHLARTDPLTGLANRRAAEERLAQEAERATRYGRPLTVLLADVDGLKQVNDVSGHQAGDGVLMEMAARLAAMVRATDLVARWGGDEFIVICPETDAAAAQLVAGKLSRVGDQPIELPDGEERCGLSVGWATEQGTVDARRLLLHSDRALYRNKDERRADPRL